VTWPRILEHLLNSGIPIKAAFRGICASSSRGSKFIEMRVDIIHMVEGLDSRQRISFTSFVATVTNIVIPLFTDEQFS